MARAALETADHVSLSTALRWPPADGRPLAAVRLWLTALAVLCLPGTWAHTGARNGFLESSRPLYRQYGGWDTLPAEGYVSWIGTVPVLSDADLLGYQELNVRFHPSLRGAW